MKRHFIFYSIEKFQPTAQAQLFRVLPERFWLHKSLDARDANDLPFCAQRPRNRASRMLSASEQRHCADFAENYVAHVLSGDFPSSEVVVIRWFLMLEVVLAHAPTPNTPLTTMEQ